MSKQKTKNVYTNGQLQDFYIAWEAMKGFYNLNDNQFDEYCDNVEKLKQFQVDMEDFTNKVGALIEEYKIREYNDKVALLRATYHVNPLTEVEDGS